MKIDVEKIKKSKTTEELLEFGILNIDKPSGPTSFDISDFVRKKLGLRKTSHFGTLDPKVTGVLPVALNRACKLTGYFIGHDKTYVGIMRIHEKKNMKDIQEVIDKKFTGKILQLPPVKSRVKRQHREREIKKFQLLEQNEKDILFETKVQGGTYIRKLLSDLGDEMKIGAHMLELRRTAAGIFSEDNKKYPSVNLYDFEKAVEKYKKGDDIELRKIIIPGEILSKIYPSVEVKEESVRDLFTGKQLTERHINEKIKENKFLVFWRDRFIGIYSKINSKSAKSEFVMQPIKQR